MPRFEKITFFCEVGEGSGSLAVPASSLCTWYLNDNYICGRPRIGDEQRDCPEDFETEFDEILEDIYVPQPHKKLFKSLEKLKDDVLQKSSNKKSSPNVKKESEKKITSTESLFKFRSSKQCRSVSKFSSKSLSKDNEKKKDSTSSQ